MPGRRPSELLELEHMGVTFHRNEEGRLGTRAFGGASAARTYYVADITGQAILHVLYEQLMKHAEVERYEEWFTTGLVLDESGHCAGAITRDLRDGSMELFKAKSVILATGGNGQCFKPTTNALICTGDGISMAYRIGAPLMDMEMIQYHPTTLAGNGLLITEGARGEGAHLYNAQRRALHGEVRARTRWSSPRATSSRAPSRPRSTRAAASRTAPSRSTSRSCRGSASTRRCARSSTSAATSPASTSRKEPIHIKPGQPLHHGRRQDRRRRPDRGPGPLRRRRVRLRLGPRRQPARRQLAARHARLRPALGRARRGSGRSEIVLNPPSEALLEDEETPRSPS